MSKVNFKQGMYAVINALGTIEGEAWKQRQYTEDGYNVATLYKAWQLINQREPEYCNAHPSDIIDPKIVGLPGEIAIYGEAGYTRYFVHLNGNIVCSRYHMPKDSPKIQKVDELGISWH